jgi:hypothetical protein
MAEYAAIIYEWVPMVLLHRHHDEMPSGPPGISKIASSHKAKIQPVYFALLTLTVH